jgi:hypothetical protein
MALALTEWETIDVRLQSMRKMEKQVHLIPEASYSMLKNGCHMGITGRTEPDSMFIHPQEGKRFKKNYRR